MIEEKKLYLEEIKSNLKPEVGFILTSYSNITANEFANMREEIVAAGGEFLALKKRVFLQAAKGLDLPYELSDLEGHVGLVISNDAMVTTTKALFKLKKGSADKLKILCGHFEGKKCTAEEFKTISDLPTLDEMRAQVVGVLEAPMSQTLAVVQALLTSVIFCIENKAKKES